MLLLLFSLQESYPAVPPIWSVESDDPNLAAVLERLVDIKKGNTLVRGPQGRGAFCSYEAHATKASCERDPEKWTVHSSTFRVRSLKGSCLPNPEGDPAPAPGLVHQETHSHRHMAHKA